MSMSRFKRITALFIMSALAIVAMSGNAAAITDDQTTLDVTTPEDESQHSVGGSLDSGLLYSYDISNDASSEDTTVDVTVELTDNDGTTETVYHNDTSLDAGETKDNSGYVPVEDFNLSEDAYQDHDVTVEAEFSSDVNSTSSTKTYNATVGLQKSTLFNMLLVILIVIAFVGAVTKKT